MPINIDLRKDLVKVRTGMRNKTLQMFKDPKLGDDVCAYSGPCAIGIMMTPEEREHLQEQGADYGSIAALISDCTINLPKDDEDQYYHVHQLQKYHDNVMFSKTAYVSDESFREKAVAKSMKAFRKLLRDLSAQYKKA